MSFKVSVGWHWFRGLAIAGPANQPSEQKEGTKDGPHVPLIRKTSVLLEAPCVPLAVSVG